MRRCVFPFQGEEKTRLPFFLEGVGCRFVQDPIDRPQGHPCYQWIQCRGRKARLTMDGKTYILEKGMGMLLLPDQPHCYRAAQSPWEVDWVIFKGDGVAPFVLEKMKIERSSVISLTAPQKLLEITETLFSGAVRDQNLCSLLVYQLLLELLWQTERKEKKEGYSKIEAAIEYIERCYDRPITLEELSARAKVTPQYFCSVFKAVTSLTPFSYINMVRIQKSKEYLLYHRQMKVAEIARKVGFEDTSYFCKIFKKYENKTPTAFRLG